MIRDVDATFDESGVYFHVDFDAKGYAEQRLKVSAFVRDYPVQYIYSALPLDDYYMDDEGRISAAEVVMPLDPLQSFSGENRVIIYLPYNVFPAAAYSYFPVIGISLDGTNENLESRFFRDLRIDVLGDEPPAGYIVNVSVRNLHVQQAYRYRGMSNSGRSWDNLLLTYGLDEIDSRGQTIPGEPHFWASAVGQGADYSDDFETIVIDVLASSDLSLRMEFVDVPDLESTKDEIDALRDAGKAARQGARFLPRLFRIAASGAGRFVNGWLWIYEIQNFFSDEVPLGTEEYTIAPDQLYALYQQTGMIDNRENWITETVVAGSREDPFQYEFTVGYWLYGYPRQREALD